MVPSRHRLRALPKQRQRRQPLAGHPQRRRPLHSRHNALMPLRNMHLRPRERRPVQLQQRLQDLAADQRRGANEQLREGLGMVLLDLGHRECGAVELEGGDAGGHAAEEGLG